MRRAADGTLQELNPRRSTRAPACTSTAAAPACGPRRPVLHQLRRPAALPRGSRASRRARSRPERWRCAMPTCAPMRGATCCWACARTIAPAGSRATRWSRCRLRATPTAGASSPRPRLLFRAAPEPRRNAAGLAHLEPPRHALGRLRAVAGRRRCPGRLRQARRLAGGRARPCYSRSGRPTACCTSSATAAAGGTCTAGAQQGAEALCPMEAEFGEPKWIFGLATYAFASARRSSAAHRNAVSHLAVLDTATLALRALETPYSSIGSWPRRTAACCSSAPRRFSRAVCLLHLDDGRSRSCAAPARSRRPGLRSVPQAIEFPTAGGLTAHALLLPAAQPGLPLLRPASGRRCWS